MLLLLLACSRPAPLSDVILISMDTTRADVISPEVTPNVAALATGGVSFDLALAHAPTTLSSHSSVFLGLDPHQHQVPRNGFAVRTDLPTLAETLGAHGFQRIGVIGASVLGSETGINRGFDVWDESLSQTVHHREERPATEVTDHALQRWAERDPTRPTFLFVHYFDAHAPYAAPEPYYRKFGDPGYQGNLDGSRASVDRLSEMVRRHRAWAPDVAELHARYEGEVAYVDSEIGRLLGGLGDAPRLVVVMGDHGEAICEPGTLAPIGHGTDVDLYALHVPLVMNGAGIPAGTHVPGLVRLSDVGATLLDLFGLGGLGEGLSRAGEARGGRHTELPLFAEANQPVPMAARGRWPNLLFERAVAQDGHLLIQAPLFGRATTLYTMLPQQRKVEDKARQTQLAALLAAWDLKAPGPVDTALPKKTRDALEALGYTEPEPASDAAGDAAPKPAAPVAGEAAAP